MAPKSKAAPISTKRDGRKGPRSAEQIKHWNKVKAEEEKEKLRKRLQELEQASSESEEEEAEPEPPAKKAKGGVVKGHEEEIAEIVSRVLQQFGGPGAAHQGTSSGGGQRETAAPAAKVDIPVGAQAATVIQEAKGNEPAKAKPVDPLRKPADDEQLPPTGLSPAASSIVKATRAAKVLVENVPRNSEETQARLQELINLSKRLLTDGDNGGKLAARGVQRREPITHGAEADAANDEAIFGH